MPETESHQRLRSRISYLNQHLQAVDAGLCLLREEAKAPQNSKKLLSDLLPHKGYTELQHPVKEEGRLLNFSRAQNVEFAIIALYRYFTEYLQGMLAELYSTKPLFVVNKAGQNFSLTFTEIVKAGTFEALSETMIQKVFRSLEELRSTPQLLEKLLKGTDVTIADGTTRHAFKYLEMRHIFAHGNGVADAKYVNNYGADFGLTVGDKLPRQYQIAADAIKAVAELCRNIDEQLLQEGFVKPVPPPPKRSSAHIAASSNEDTASRPAVAVKPVQPANPDPAPPTT